MKKLSLITIVIFLAFFITVPNLYAGGTSTPPDACKTKHPIVLCHGVALNDIGGVVDYFDGVQERLESYGAKVYIAQVDKMAAGGTKAFQFAEYLNTYVFPDAAANPAYDYSKVNIIGHSHGGMYTRMAIVQSSYTSPVYGPFTWNLPASKIASLTQVNSPNLGSPVADFLLEIDSITQGMLTSGLDFVYEEVMNAFFGSNEGDVYGDNYQNAIDLSIEGSALLYASLGGDNTIPGVYCQNYMHVMKEFLCLPILDGSALQLLAVSMPIQCGAYVIGYPGGPHLRCDGVVSVHSSDWGLQNPIDDGGILQTTGIDHCNATGLPYGFTGVYSAPDKFQYIVMDLKNRSL